MRSSAWLGLSWLRCRSEICPSTSQTGHHAFSVTVGVYVRPDVGALGRGRAPGLAFLQDAETYRRSPLLRGIHQHCSALSMRLLAPELRPRKGL